MRSSKQNGLPTGCLREERIDGGDPAPNALGAKTVHPDCRDWGATPRGKIISIINATHRPLLVLLHARRGKGTLCQHQQCPTFLHTTTCAIWIFRGSQNPGLDRCSRTGEFVSVSFFFILFFLSAIIRLMSPQRFRSASAPRTEQHQSMSGPTTRFLVTRRRVYTSHRLGRRLRLS
jgi:hypothetical protein